jgi:nicotinamide mononucleotide transporter
MNWSPWEILAVATGIGFLLLAIRENPWCWVSGGISTTIFLVLFWNAGLYMQSLLQAYYIGISIYGWWHWKQRSDRAEKLPVRRWPRSRHLLMVCLILSLGGINGYLLSRNIDSQLPYLDALTTWGGLLTTWMAARKILENWLYWLFINAAAIYLYLNSGLPITAGLFMVYFLLALRGYSQWKRSYREQSA